MDLMLISTALSVVFSLVAGSMLSVSESCYLQIILVVFCLLSIRLKPNPVSYTHLTLPTSDLV